MSVISAGGIKQAYKDSETYILNTVAKNEYNIHHNDGMTLKIAQDNKLDLLINSIDGRRIKLEKQAEILHDYYGDRLLAKELFDQYLSYKKKTGGVANILSVGILGANLYTRVLKNSVFMGKIGTLSSIIALQCAGRYLSNNKLESMIERPWKIHCVRMSKGLGPTNTPANYHPEIITTPIRFNTSSISVNELLYGTRNSLVPAMLDLKLPLDGDHFPYFPDEGDMNQLTRTKFVKFKRAELLEPEDDGKFIVIPEKFHNTFPFTGVLMEREYKRENELFKNWNVRAGLTIWRPEHSTKKVAFEALKPEQLFKDYVIEKNLYNFDPHQAELDVELPAYAQKFRSPINITEDRLELLKFHWLQRLKFKNLKKMISEEYSKTKNADDIKAKFEEFHEQMKKEEHEFLLKNVKFAAPEVQKNKLDDKKYFMLFENDKEALKEYFENIVQTRPEMIKNEKYEYPYDWDFEVDLENYDPWQEYKLIYRDLFKKGRAYFILKRIPDWRFLQVGKVQSEPYNAISQYDPRRRNMRDSIFTMLTIERYFDERQKKEGFQRGKSQAIRI